MKMLRPNSRDDLRKTFGSARRDSYVKRFPSRYFFQFALFGERFSPQQSVGNKGILPFNMASIENVVTSFDVGCTLDLKKIAEEGWHVEYNPGKFNAVTMRIRQPRATCLIFSSGKLNCSGTKSEKDARKASRKFARILQKIANPEAKFKNYRVTNVVASFDAGFPINLVHLTEANPDSSEYDAEKFPAAMTFQVQNPKVTARIFSSGKVNLMGAENQEQIHDAAEQIRLILACQMPQ